jgi:hypothetical protein
MKKWFIDRFLPMWAKQTVLQDNRQLRRENQKLMQEVERLDAYIAGIHRGLRGAGKQTGGLS